MSENNEKKDYLSSLMEEDSGPLESFKEEKVETIARPRRKIRKVWIVVGVVLLAAIGFAIYWFFFAPKIEVPNFVGQNVSNVTTWLSQNDIERSKVALQEEYSMEYDKDMVISQSVDEGKKITTSTALTFVVSLGADPDESITVPDLENMNETEIRAWIDENKLQRTKINRQYSSSVTEGAVISVDFGSTDRDYFTRGSSLTINVSRGPEPAGTTSVSNFVGKAYTEVESWAKQHDITVEKLESFSSSVEAGMVISQSVESGELLKDGDTFTVTVSKGKGITIPNLVGYDDVMFEAWKTEASGSGLTIIPKEVYNEAAEGTVVAQDVSAGTTLGSGDVLIVTVSKYLPILNSESSREWLGKDYISIQRWADGVNADGADIQTGEYAGMLNYSCSDEFSTPGQIVNYWCAAIDGTELAHGCDRPLPLNARIGITVSTGACTVEATDTPTTTPVITLDLSEKLDGKKLSATDFLAWAQGNGINNISISSDVEQLDDSSENYYEVVETSGWQIVYSSKDANQNSTMKSDCSYIIKLYEKPTEVSPEVSETANP